MNDEDMSESPPYAAEHRATIDRGLGILARVAIRAYLQRQGIQPNTPVALLTSEQGSE